MMVPKSANELQHELSRLTQQDIEAGRALAEVDRDIVQAERELADARRRKAAQEAQR